MTINCDEIAEVIFRKVCFEGEYVYPGDNQTKYFGDFMTDDEVINVLRSLIVKIDKSSNRKNRNGFENNRLDSDEIDGFLSYVDKLLYGHKNFKIFMEFLEFYKMLLSYLGVPYFNLLDESVNEYMTHIIFEGSVRTIVFNSFDFESFSKEELKIIEGYILKYYDELSLVYHLNYQSRKCTGFKNVRRLCPALTNSIPFSNEFILENYDKLIPWFIASNKKINHTYDIQLCIFGKMTDKIMEDIFEYICQYRVEFKTTDEDAALSALKYSLSKEE